MASREQDVDDVEHAVEDGGGRLDVLVAVLHVGTAVGVDDLLHGRLSRLELGTGRQRDEHGRVEVLDGVGAPRLPADQVVAGDVALPVDGADPEVGGRAVEERHRDRGADLPVVVFGDRFGHGDLALPEVVDGPVADVEVEHVAEL